MGGNFSCQVGFGFGVGKKPRKLHEHTSQMLHGLNLVQQEPLHQGSHLSPPVRLISQSFLPRLRDFVVLGFPVVLGFAPGSLDPSVLFKPDQRRIKRPLVEIEQAIGYLLETGGNLIGVLGAHGEKRSQHDEIESSLEQLDWFSFFTRHASGVSRKQDLSVSLVCQLEFYPGRSAQECASFQESPL